MYRFTLHVTIKLLTFLSVLTAGNEPYIWIAESVVYDFSWNRVL